MNLIISKPIFDLYPDLSIGILLVDNVNNKKNPEVSTLLHSAEEALRQRTDMGNVKEYPAIASWREAHKLFGNNPNRYAPSVEAVIKRVVKGGNLPDINPLVDLYNIICMKYIVPVGGEDLDTCVGDIELAIADGSEAFVGLGDEKQDSPKAGEVVYKDNAGVLCRRFNWREADRTKLTESTTRAMIVIEGISPTTQKDVEQALEELRILVEKYVGATTRSEVLNAQRAMIEI